MTASNPPFSLTYDDKFIADFLDRARVVSGILYERAPVLGEVMNLAALYLVGTCASEANARDLSHSETQLLNGLAHGAIAAFMCEWGVADALAEDPGALDPDPEDKDEDETQKAFIQFARDWGFDLGEVAE